MPRLETSVRSRHYISAARALMEREGVANATMRGVAAEAGVPLGNLQYLYPTKEVLLRAVIEDVMSEIERVLSQALRVKGGLARSIRQGITMFWTELVQDQIKLQVMQGELLDYMLRTPGHEDLARWQYQGYAEVLADWCRQAATEGGETCSLPFESLARLLLAGVDGLTLQYVCDPDKKRARADLATFVDMVIAQAQITKDGP